MAIIKMINPEHGQHLCYLNNLEFQKSNPGKYKDLVRNSKYMCKNCGRTASNKINLCEPVKL